MGDNCLDIANVPELPHSAKSGMVMAMILVAWFTTRPNRPRRDRFGSASLLLMMLSVQALATSPIERGIEQIERQAAQVFAHQNQLRDRISAASLRVMDSQGGMAGRLTTSATQPIPTTDQSNASTIYFLPYRGERVALWNGSEWQFYKNTSPPSLALSGLTAGTNYDVFLYDNSGTLAIESPLTAWTNNTTRTTALVFQDGVPLKSGALTRRYIGTIRATGAAATQDTSSQRFVWNYYNRVPRFLLRQETTDNWLGTNAVASMNASTANRVEFVIGLNESLIETRALSLMTGTNATVRNASIALCLDGTTVQDSDLRGARSINTVRSQSNAIGFAYPPGTAAASNIIGYHFYQWVEASQTNVRYYGDDAGDARVQSGFLAWVDG